MIGASALLVAGIGIWLVTSHEGIPVLSKQHEIAFDKNSSMWLNDGFYVTPVNKSKTLYTISHIDNRDNGFFELGTPDPESGVSAIEGDYAWGFTYVDSKPKVGTGTFRQELLLKKDGAGWKILRELPQEGTPIGFFKGSSKLLVFDGSLERFLIFDGEDASAPPKTYPMPKHISLPMYFRALEWPHMFGANPEEILRFDVDQPKKLRKWKYWPGKTPFLESGVHPTKDAVLISSFKRSESMVEKVLVKVGLRQPSFKGSLLIEVADSEGKSYPLAVVPEPDGDQARLTWPGSGRQFAITSGKTYLFEVPDAIWSKLQDLHMDR